MPRHESLLACPLTVWPAIALLACHGDPPTGTSPQTVTDIAVVPASAALFTGGTATFQAVATLSDGSQVALTPAWAATGGAINPLGVYTAGAAGGTFRVVASSAAGLADTAIVTVIPDPLTMSGEVAAAADSFVQSVGVNIHLSYANIYSNFGLVKSMLAELGVKHVRDGGQAYDDPALMTRIHGRMKDLNLTLGIKANYIADAFGDPSAWDFSDTRGMDSVVKYAGAATIESFEGLNEWNSKRDARPNWAGEVRQRQQAIWAHVTSKYPQYLVVGPSFTNYVDACTVGDLSGYQHLGNMHPYPAGEPQTASLQENIANLQCVNGTSDALVSTETGYQNALQSTSRNRAVSELASGKYVPRLYLAAFNSGVRRSYGYELIDEGVSNTDAEARFGLYRNDGSPKPAATALQHLVALLADSSGSFPTERLDYQLAGDLTSVSHTLLQKRDRRFYLALWLEVSSYDLAGMSDVSVAPRPLTLTLGRPVAWRVFRPNAGAGVLASGTDSTLSLSVPDEVLLVEITP